MVSEKDLSVLMNNIVASSNYIPTTADLKWTRDTISGTTVWASPAAGYILFFDHGKKVFHLALNGSPTEDQLLKFAKTRANLIMLGYREGRKDVIADTVTVEDIAEKIGLEGNIIYESEKIDRLLDDWKNSQD